MPEKKTQAVWQVSRTGDPITDTATCFVAAYERAAGMSFTRVGARHPFVENSSTYGLLGGVSSGDKWRLPTGEIVRRVDAHLFRT